MPAAARRFIVVVVLIPNADKSQLLRFEHQFNVDTADLRRAQQWVVALLRLHGCPVEPLTYCIESTACYHYPVVRTWGGTPTVLNPTIASQFKSRKTDRWDTSRMAHQMLTGTWESTWLPSEETEVLRCLLRTRKKVQTHITRNHAQISLRLSQWYCPLEGRSARLAGVRAVCEDYAAGRSPDVSTLPCFQSAHLVPRRIWALIQQHYDAVDVAEKQLKDLWAAVLETLPDKELFKLNISIRTLWRLVATGQFPQPKRYNRELVRWPTQVFRRWLAQQAADEGE